MCTICAQMRPFDPDCPYRGTGNSGPPAATITETTDAADSTATTYRIAVGDTFNGTLGVDDFDRIAITLQAGETYTFRLNGVSGGVDTYLQLQDQNGDFLGYDDDGGEGTNSVLTHTATRSGTFFVRVSEYNGDSGSYQLTTEVPAPLPTFTLDQIADQLITGYHEWSGYAGTGPRSFDRDPGQTITVNLNGLPSEIRDVARVALGEWALVTGLVFSEVAGAADIAFDDDEAGAFARTTVSGTTIVNADVNIEADWLISQGEPYFYQTYLHEIGHALGLGHAGNYNGNATWGTDNSYRNDSWQATVMSYFDQEANTFVDASYANIATPMMADIIAIQRMYGTPTGIRAGNTVYGVNSTAGGVLDQMMDTRIPVAGTIFDQGGIDHLDLSTVAVNQRIDLRPQAISDILGLIGNLSIARGTVIENATGGSADDRMTGNGVSNTLTGGAGRDTIEGLGGNDWLTGGTGNDSLDGGDGLADMVSFLNSLVGFTVNLVTDTAVAGAETDIVRNIENITGSIYADFLTGDAGANRLRGMGHYDWFIASAGADTMEGGTGLDMVSYQNATAGVVVNLGTGRGTGGLANGHTYLEVERATGSSYADTFFGSRGEDEFRGLGGNDTFMGSLGRDRYDGGSGLDTASYANATAAVSASLALGRGALGDAALDLYTLVENLTGSNFADNLSGDAGRNELMGLGGDDMIFGNANGDRMTGGGGNDTVDGGDGYDYAVFSGLRAQYLVSTAGGVTTVSHTGGTRLDGIDQLTTVEVLVFSDGSLLI